MFTKKEYDKEVFTNISISKQDIKDIFFEECEFIQSSFIECKFINCSFINCKFKDCILSAITPLNGRYIDIKFKDSNVIGIDWAKVEHIQDISFNKCKLNYSNFKLLKLPKIKIIDCEAKEVDFSQCNMKEGIFTNTDFKKSIFNSTNLSKTDFRNSKNYFIDIRYNTVKGAKFSLPEAISLLKSLEIEVE